jgi:uncharacterized protein
MAIGANRFFEPNPGTYSSDGRFLRKTFAYRGARGSWLALPMLAVKTASVAVFSNTAPPPKLSDLVPRIHQPLLLIWATDGGAETMNPTYFRLAQGPKSIWGIPEIGHMGGITAHPKEYERRVIAFLEGALPSDE